MENKTCSKCGETKALTSDNFYKQKNKKDGYRPDCKICRNKINKKWSDKPENIERKKEISSNWRQNNREKHLQRCSEWAKNNRDKANIRAKENYHTKYKLEPYFRMKRSVSSAIHKSLRDDGGRMVWEYLPYKPQQLKEHLESQFDENMNWDNYGSYWHIDHIYPQSKLPYDNLDHPHFRLVWDLNNLRPLGAKENMSKGDEIPEIIPEHIKNYLENEKK